MHYMMLKYGYFAPSTFLFAPWRIIGDPRLSLVNLGCKELKVSIISSAVKSLKLPQAMLSIPDVFTTIS